MAHVPLPNRKGWVLDDVSEPDECFRVLHEHFANPDSWSVDPEAADVLRELAGRGFLLGLCSNFDRRLREQKLTLEDYLKIEGKTAEQFREEMKPQAEARMKRSKRPIQTLARYRAPNGPRC